MQRVFFYILLGIYIIIYFYICLFVERSELKYRQVKYFGFEFKYGINDVDVDDFFFQGIFSVCFNFFQRVLVIGYVIYDFDQLTVN